jgi:predicted phosphodiesterase
MERLAAVSDIHGNLPALDAVLADIARERVDATLNLGDILSGPLWPAETAERLMALNLPTIAGNHERQVLAGRRLSASDAHTAARLTDAHRAWLAALPATLHPAPGIACCHGTPASDLVYLLETVTDDFDRSAGRPGIRAATTTEVAQRLAGLGAGGLVLCGHSHVPRMLQLDDGTLVVNPGSVGLPAYDDVHPHPHVVEVGAPHARYALLTRRVHGHTTGWQVELRAVPYPHAAAARQAEANGRGDWADALRSGRVGRFEAEVTGAAA